MFAGKKIVITGAGSGIGRCLAELFAGKHKAKVWLCDIDTSRTAEVAQEIRNYGGDCAELRLDVTAFEAIAAARDKIIATDGSIDIWINNAGVFINGPFLSSSLGEFQKLFDINFHGLVHCTKLAWEHMEDRGSGMIVNIASVAGQVACPYMSAYVASKHAVVGFTRSLQAELDLNQSPVRMLLVSPGFVDTAILTAGKFSEFPEWLRWLLASPESVAKEIVRGIKLGRREIAPAVNGKLMLALHKVMPQTAVKSSKIFLTKSFKDYILNRYQV